MTHAIDEPVFRKVNRRIHELTHSHDGPSGYLCECGHSTCRATMVDVDPTDFDDILEIPYALMVARRHEPPGAERLRVRPGYLIIRAPAD